MAPLLHRAAIKSAIRSFPVMMQ